MCQNMSAHYGPSVMFGVLMNLGWSRGSMVGRVDNLPGRRVGFQSNVVRDRGSGVLLCIPGNRPVGARPAVF